jgi:transcriptional regulator with XRE-family HTH domain
MIADYYIIKQERFNQGRTQKELADMAQISLSTVIKAERGGSISPRSNRAIRDALGLK